jgi:hypothetical protein
MDLAKRGHKLFADLRRALNPALTRARGLCVIKWKGGDRIGKLGQRPPVVNLGLGSLDLQLVENPGQLGDLAIVEIEPVRQKPEWPAHSERGTPVGSIPIMMVALAFGHEALPPEAALPMRAMPPRLMLVTVNMFSVVVVMVVVNGMN